MVVRSVEREREREREREHNNDTHFVAIIAQRVGFKSGQVGLG